MGELKYWVWMSSLSKIRKDTLVKLLGDYGSPQKIFFESEDNLKLISYLKPYERAALMDKDLSRARDIIDICNEMEFRIITIDDTVYPERLKNIYDPPLVLYVRGKLPDVDDEAVVGVVGTRECTAYGRVSADKIAWQIAKCGGVVVTGLAKGIDAAATRGALRAGGKVIGVLGCGIERIYPQENKTLFEDVYKNGAVISEFPPGSEPDKYHFPIRNRIISGLSLGVAVVEAPAKSGALITAERALDQGRDVFSVPGNIDCKSFVGSNRLIRDGAMLITSGVEIMEEYVPLFPEKLSIDILPYTLDNANAEVDKISEKAVVFEGKEDILLKKVVDKTAEQEYIELLINELNLDGDEKAVIQVLGEEPMHIDDIVQKAERPSGDVLAALTVLEISGAVKSYPGKLFGIGRE